MSIAIRPLRLIDPPWVECRDDSNPMARSTKREALSRPLASATTRGRPPLQVGSPLVMWMMIHRSMRYSLLADAIHLQVTRVSTVFTLLLPREYLFGRLLHHAELLFPRSNPHPGSQAQARLGSYRGIIGQSLPWCWICTVGASPLKVHPTLGRDLSDHPKALDSHVPSPRGPSGCYGYSRWCLGFHQDLVGRARSFQDHCTNGCDHQCLYGGALYRKPRFRTEVHRELLIMELQYLQRSDLSFDLPSSVPTEVSTMGSLGGLWVGSTCAARPL